MYQGYLEFNGIPLINGEATEAWVEHLAPTMALKRVFRTDKLHIANQEAAYRTPVLDEAPWVNPLDPVTHGFFGLYPTSIEGLGDSTLSSTVTEGIEAGGTIGDSREGTRPIRVSGVLVAQSKLSAQAGLTWLRAALRTDGCEGCLDGTLRYFLAEPDICEIAFSDETGVAYRNLGDLAAGDSFRYRFQPDDGVDRAQPARVWWTGSFAEGASYIYGAMSRRDGTILQQYGPIGMSRVNHLPNPSAEVDSTGWAPTGAYALAQLPTGGADGGGYLAATLDESVSTAGLFGRGLFGEGDFGDASPLDTSATLGGGGFGEGAFGIAGADPTGAPYGSGTYGDGAYGVGVTAAAAEAALSSVTSSSQDALAAGPITASLALRAATADPITLALLDSTGATLGSVQVTPEADWQRVTISAVAASAGAITLQLIGVADFDLDQAILESGAGGDYFDGDSSVPGATASWIGVPNGSASQLTGVGADTLSFSWPDSDFRPFLQMVSGSASSVQLNWATRDPIDVPAQLQPYERWHYSVGATQGAQVIQELDLGAAGFFIQVDFVLTAGNPFAYSSPVAIDTTPLANTPFVDPTADSGLDDSWLVDPDAIPVTAPVAAPVILDPAIETISSWERYYVPIPATDVADWAASVPTVSISTLGAPIKQVRVRFHPNPLQWEPDAVDPLSFCSEFVLSYLPSRALLTVDAAAKSASASKAGFAAASANHLLYGSGGGPVIWPELSCAIPYLMTVDVPTPADIDLIEVGLSLQRKE